MSVRVCVWVLWALAGLLLVASQASAAWVTGGHAGTLRAPGQLMRATGMTLDAAGNVYIADTGYDRVQKFDPSGTYLGEFGVPGSANGQFNDPTDVAVDAGGDIWVVDSGNDRVQRFSAAGAYLDKFGGWGSTDGTFSGPWGIALAPGGNIYVTDRWNQRVQIFDPSGAYLSQFGSFGSANGQFDTPHGIAVKSDGTVYVADTFNDRIQSFTAGGTFISRTTTGAHGDPFAAVSDVTVDASGNVYVADSWHGVVQKLDSNLTYLAHVGGYNYLSGLTGFVDVSSVAVDASGNVFALDRSYDRVLTFTSAGALVGRFGTAGTGEMAHPESLTRAADGSYYVVDSTNDRVLHWSTAGVLLNTFGSLGSGDGQLSGPSDVAVGPNGAVYVADSRNCRVQRFSAAGVYEAKFGSCGTDPGQFQVVTGIDVSRTGTVVVTDALTARVQRFTANGAFISAFGTPGNGAGQLNQPSGVAIADDGSIYITEIDNHRVQHFDGVGNALGTFGSQGGGPGQLVRPRGVAVSPDGSVYVVDWGNQRLNRYAADGTFIEAASGYDEPTDIVVGSANFVAVADTGADTIQQWLAESYAPAGLGQFQSDASTQLAQGSTSDQTTAVLQFDVGSTIGLQTLTPRVEIQPIGTPLNTVCGASVAGATFSGAALRATERATLLRASVRVTGLVSGVDYHWRACTTDQDDTPSPWTSMGGSDGTRDFRVDTSGPFAVRGVARRDETGTTAWQACDGYTPNVRLSVAGAAPVSTSCNRATGDFSFTGLTKPTAGELLVVWMEDAASRGAVYYSVAADASAVSLQLVQDRVRLGTELVTDTITRSELQIQDSVDAAAIAVDATSGGRLTTASTTELHVDAGVTFVSQGQLDIGSFHIAATATLDTASAQVRVRGTGTLDDCVAGPRRSTPMCVEHGGTVAPIPTWVDWHYDPTDAARRVGVSTDVHYSSLRLAGGVDYTLGTRRGQTLRARSQLDFGGGSRTESDTFAPDIDMYNMWVGYGARWSGRRAFTVQSADGFAGDGALDLPRADVTILGRSPMTYVASNYSDWDLGSLTILGSNGRHDFATGGRDVHDGGASDDPVAVVTDNGNQHIYVVYNRDNGVTGSDWVIRKYYTFSSGLDTSFGVAGELAVAVPGTDVATSAQLASNGNLLVAGGVGGSWAVKAFNIATGALDPTFDGDGAWEPGTTGSVTALLQHQGNIFVAGSDGSDTWQIVRLDGSGALLDTNTWDGDTGSGAQPASITAMCGGPSWEAGDVTVVGDVGSAGARDWAVGLLRPSGATWGWSPFITGAAQPEPITSVGTEDHATTCYSSTTRMLIGGTSGDGGASNVATIRAYDRRNGAPSVWFGTGGVATFDGPGEDELASIRGFDLRNAFTVLTGDEGGDGGRAVVRALDMDGRVDPSFNEGAGSIVYDDSPGPERPVALTYAWQLINVLARSASNAGDASILQFDASGDVQDGWTTGTGRAMLLGAGRSLHLHGDLTIGSNDPAYKTVFDAKAFDGDLEVDGDIQLNGDAVLRAPRVEPLVAHGDITIAGTFYDGAGTVRIDPHTKRVRLHTLPSTTFHRLQIDATEGGADVLFDADDDIRVTGQFDAVGHSCGAPLRLRPDGPDWTLDTAGAVDGDIRNVDLANVSFTPARPVTSSWDSGGVSGTAPSAACSAAGDPGSPEGLLVNGTSRPRDIAPDPAPVFEWRNQTGSDIDTVDARVLSSSPQGVEALFHFDAGSESTDASGKSNTVVADTTTPTTGRFGAGRATTLSESVQIPDLPIDQEFTVGIWFKRGPLTGGDATFPVLIDRCIFVCSVKNFDMHIDSASNRIFGEVTTNAGARTHTALTDAAPFLDNRWHYATLTHGANQLRLFMDGVLMDTTPTGPGPIDVGPWTTNAGWNFNGAIDEVSLRSTRASEAEIHGYYRTHRPHVDEVWADPAMTVPAVSNGATAAVGYGGPSSDLALEGARWWVDARFRTTGAAWSARSASDWFETTLADRTTVSLPDGSLAALGSLTPGDDLHDELRVRVASSSALGWTLRVQGEDDGYALSNGLAGADNQIARRTTPLWPTGEAGFAGITVLSAPGGKSAPWCGGTDPTDFDGQCYAWPDASTGMTLHATAVPNVTPLDTAMSVRVNVANTTRAGAYSGRLSLVAVPNV